MLSFDHKHITVFKLILFEVFLAKLVLQKKLSHKKTYKYVEIYFLPTKWLWLRKTRSINTTFNYRPFCDKNDSIAKGISLIISSVWDLETYGEKHFKS